MIQVWIDYLFCLLLFTLFITNLALPLLPYRHPKNLYTSFLFGFSMFILSSSAVSPSPFTIYHLERSAPLISLLHKVKLYLSYRHNGFYDSPGIALDFQQTPYGSALWFFFHVLQSDIHLSCLITLQLEPLPNRNVQVIIYLFVRTVFGGLSIYFFNFLIISNFFSLCVPFFISIYKTFRTLCIILIMSFLVIIECGCQIYLLFVNFIH